MTPIMGYGTLPGRSVPDGLESKGHLKLLLYAIVGAQLILNLGNLHSC